MKEEVPPLATTLPRNTPRRPGRLRVALPISEGAWCRGVMARVCGVVVGSAVVMVAMLVVTLLVSWWCCRRSPLREVPPVSSPRVCCVMVVPLAVTTYLLLCALSGWAAMCTGDRIAGTMTTSLKEARG